MKTYKSFLFTSILIVLFSAHIFAQASLAAENIIDDIVVTTKHGKQKVYTVFRDAIKTTQWYYMPNELRVAEEIVKRKTRPKMTILKYQFQDIITKDNKEGGVLVATFTYAIEPEVVESVKAQIKAKKGGNTNLITLSAIPLSSSQIDFLTNSGEFIGNVDAKTSSGATSASQEMVVCFNLSVIGAGIFEELATGAGLPVRANIKYNGLSAPCGYTINAKWDQVYKYYEKLTKKEFGLSYKRINVGGGSSSEQKNETLTSFKDMGIQVIECEAKTTNTPSKDSETNSETEDDGGLSEAKKKIEAEIFNDTFMSKAAELEKLQALLYTPTVQNDAATKNKIIAAMNSLTGGLTAGWQKSLKDITKQRKGEIKYDFTKQRLVIRETTFGGLLSFQKYGMTLQQLKDEGYLIDVDINSKFPCVIIGLPNINPDFDLKTLTLEVGYKNSNGQTTYEARQWDVLKNGWMTPTGKDNGYIRFNMIGEKNKQRQEEPEFKVKLQVISKIPNASFVIERSIKLSKGERYIDALELLTKQFIIDGSNLDFSRITNSPTDLSFAKLVFSKGSVTINKDIKAFLANGVAGPPNPIYVLLPNNDAPLTAKVTFTKNNGEKIERKEPIELGENTLSNFEWKENNN